MLKNDSEHLPEFLSVPKSQIEEHWDRWILWRMVGKRVEAFTLALKLPKALLDTLFFLDEFYEKMADKKLRDEAKQKTRKHGK